MNANGNRRLMPVALHGAPRSGPTWVGELLNSSESVIYRFQPLFSYALKDYLCVSSPREDIDRFFELLAETSDDPFLNQTPQRLSGKLPRFTKGPPSHIVYKEVRYHGIVANLLRRTEDVRAVLMIRNPLSVISSWLKAPREFRADLGWLAKDEWRYALRKNMNRPEEYYGFERWKDAANLFLSLQRHFPERVCLIEYRTLLCDPVAEVARMFDFLDIEVREQTLAFLEDSTRNQSTDVYSVFRADASDDKWQRDLDPAIASAIQDDLRGTPLERFCHGD